MTKELRILLADDHATVRAGLKAILESQVGWKVIAETGNGEEALKLATEEKPNLAILDLSMPGLNGVDLTRSIRKRLPLTEVLILSMNFSSEIVMETVRAGAKGFILKTEGSRLILAAVENVSQGQSFYSGAVASFVATPAQNQSSGGAARLTTREREIVRLLAEGCTTKDVAIKLGISAKTVDVHRTNIMRRLNIHAVAELVRYAIREKMIEP